MNASTSAERKRTSPRKLLRGHIEASFPRPGVPFSIALRGNYSAATLKQGARRQGPRVRLDALRGNYSAATLKLDPERVPAAARGDAPASPRKLLRGHIEALSRLQHAARDASSPRKLLRGHIEANHCRRRSASTP